MRNFIEELKRRNVLKIAGLYVVFAWVLLQVADVVVPAAGLSEWLVTFVLYLTIIGFPFALMLSWMFDLTWKGVKQDSQDAATRQFRFFSPAVVVLIALFVGSSFVAYRISQPPPDLTPSIAVIPFANLTGDEGNEFLSDGITEEILNRLFRLDNLKVIARTSVFALKSLNLDLSEIGSRLEVEHVLEGNLQINGDVVRLGVRLISIASGKRLWAETFDGELNDFEFQDDIVNTVTAAIARVFGRKPPPERKIATREVLAQEHYLRGRYYYEQRGQENMERAAKLFQQAIDVDPLYSDAWGALGQVIALAGVDPQITDDRVDAIIAKALELDPDNPRALAAKAFIAGYRDWDFATALQLARRTIEIAPGDGDARHWFAITLALSGHFEAALAEQRIAAPLNPLYPPLLEGIGHRLRYLWRFEEAVEIYQQSIRNGFDRVYDNLFFVYGHLGRVEDAAKILLRDNRQTELDNWDRMMLAYFGGDREEAARLYKAHLLARRSPASEAHPGEGRDAAYGSDLDYAFEVMIASAEVKHLDLLRMLRSKVPVELYSDPRWVELWHHPNMKPVFDLYLEAGDAPWIPIMNTAIAERGAGPIDR
jgi:TolB-like protein